jgi:DNA-binding PadR family transcriptional regulator
VNTFVPDMVTNLGEEPQKKQKNYYSISEKGRDKNYQKLKIKIQTQTTMAPSQTKLISLLSLSKITVVELFPSFSNFFYLFFL